MKQYIVDITDEALEDMDSEPGHSRGIRLMSVGHYAVFYIIEEETVKVTNVLYGASDINSRLRR